MNQEPRTVLQDLRALLPGRTLQEHEARGIAERQATRLLSIFTQVEPPVDVGLIAELPRIEVRVVPSQTIGRDLSGLTHWDRSKGRWLVAINRDDSRTRRRFSLAHEFKHIVDNQHIHVLYAATSDQVSDKRREDACDWFAACLLMPRPWVKRLWAQGIQDVAVLAAIFQVSPAAMARRLRELGLTEQQHHWRMGRDEWPSAPTYFRQSALALTA
jgi:Zn-dependent peptidase ImmA (M78 family)